MVPLVNLIAREFVCLRSGLPVVDSRLKFGMFKARACFF